MRKTELQRFRKMLQEEKDRVTQSLAQHEKIIMHKDDQSGLETGKAHSNHMADQGSDEFQYETTIKFANTEGRYLYNIEEALRRIEDGTYGKCIDCGKKHRPAAAETAALHALVHRLQGEGGGGEPLMSSRFFPPWIWAPLILILDFASKRLVIAEEVALRARINVIGDFVRFIYVRNPGSAMGLFPVERPFLIVFSMLASIGLVFLYQGTDPRRVVRRSAIAAVLGGALGNLIDRIFYEGRVVDFIDIGLGTHRFYTFNVADIGVSVGGAVLFLCFLLEGRRSHD